MDDLHIMHPWALPSPLLLLKVLQSYLALTMASDVVLEIKDNVLLLRICTGTKSPRA
jgi:hypothetical protein